MLVFEKFPVSSNHLKAPRSQMRGMNSKYGKSIKKLTSVDWNKLLGRLWFELKKFQYALWSFAGRCLLDLNFDWIITSRSSTW